MSVKAPHITSPSTVCSATCSGWQHRKQRANYYWSFMRGIHRSPVEYSYKGPVMWKVFYAMARWLNRQEIGFSCHSHWSAVILSKPTITGSKPNMNYSAEWVGSKIGSNASCFRRVAGWLVHTPACQLSFHPDESAWHQGPKAKFEERIYIYVYTHIHVYIIYVFVVYTGRERGGVAKFEERIYIYIYTDTHIYTICVCSIHGERGGSQIWRKNIYIHIYIIYIFVVYTGREWGRERREGREGKREGKAGGKKEGGRKWRREEQERDESDRVAESEWER